MNARKPRIRPHRVLVAIVIGAAALVPAHAAVAAPSQSAVASWIQITLDEIPAHGVNPPRASRVLAHVSVAMHDAAFATLSNEDSAVAGAASTVLAHFFSDRAAYFESVAAPAAAQDPTAFAAGQSVGAALVARARSDGSDAQWTGVTPVGPCVWAPTPPAFIYPPLEPMAGTWRTWNIASGAQFRPLPPPACDSKAYRLAYREVYKISRSLTREQKRIADYWADGPGSVTPPGHWNLIALDLVRANSLSTLASARVFAALNTAQADAFIACWDSKYAYWLERPVTTIRREFDPDWMPYLTTPPVPAYTSGHATTSGAAAEVLAHFFPSDAVQLRAWAEEAAMSRLYGGIHFRFDNDEGLALGRKVADVALASRFVSG
jgi:membrane-associated phospholipid phosphatase